jgi:uncharacterized integral membrane protein
MTEHDSSDSSDRPPPEDFDEKAAPPFPHEPGPSFPWRLSLFLVLIVFVVIFTVQNTQSVELRFLQWAWALPMAVIILISVVVTIVLDQILGGILKRRRLRLQRERKELKRLRQSP